MNEPAESDLTATEVVSSSVSVSTETEVVAPDVVSPVVPPVVVVMVTRDPGWWFEEVLNSVAAQTYDNVSVFVVDAASSVDLSARIAASLPSAHLKQLSDNPGFGAACNEALDAVTGAAFYLFCHDDVVLAPDVIQVLVEEAFRSNAGVVGPKIVDWNNPDRLLSVGMGSDKHGFPVSSVERNELDQAQHDGVRDVFYVPGAATLVRADLFEILGGFDSGITFHADDLDLCWRTHVVGARVIVAPQASVRHLEALGERRPVDDRRKLQMRHRLRAAKISYSAASRLRIMPQSFLLALLELVYCLVLGRFRQVKDVASAWTWNWAHSSDIRTRRRYLHKHRVARDREVRHMQSRGSRRLMSFLRGQIGSNGDRLLIGQAGRANASSAIRSSKVLTSLSVWLVLVVILIVGSRHLIFSHLAAVGDLPMFGSSSSELLREWVSGYRSVGLGSEAANPTGLGLIGFFGLAFFDNLDLLRKVLVLGMLPLGALGMWRLVKPIGTRRSRAVGLIVYMAIPVSYNAIAQGWWVSLVVFGLTPWILSQLVRASRLAPFGPVGGEEGPGVRQRPMMQRIIALGVLGALAMMLSPLALAIVPIVAVALVIGGLLAGQLAGALRVLVAAIGGVVVALVLHLPWSTTFLSGDLADVVGISSSSGMSLSISQIVRFNTGPWGGSSLGFAFLLAAGVALLIARHWRLAWAIRSWSIIAVSFGCVWLAGQDWVSVDLSASELLFAPAAAGLALSSAMGMAAFEVDLPDYHFGWRQILAILGGAALVVGALPMIGGSTDGRWGLARGDYNRPLAFIDKEIVNEPFRVLWMGEAESLPVPGWPLDAPALDDLGSEADLVFATTDNGTPTVADRWPGSMSAATKHLNDALVLAADGGTSRLGAMLAPMGVRYIVVPLGKAPAPYTKDPQRPEQLLSMLEGQLDFSSVDVNVGVVVYRNTAWGPARALLPAGTEVPTDASDSPARTLPAVQGAPVALPNTDHFADFSGGLDAAAEVYLSAASSTRWRLVVDGEDVPRKDAMGWSNVFSVDHAGAARLYFDTPSSRPLLLAGQVLLWLAATFYILRVRVVTDERRTLEAES